MKKKFILLVLTMLCIVHFYGQSSFSSNFQTVCVNQVINFYPDNTTASSYSWSFPGATTTTSVSKFPTITYSTPGNYDVELNINGNKTLLKKYIRVVLNMNNNSYLSESNWLFGNGTAYQKIDILNHDLSSKSISQINNSQFTNSGRGSAAISNFDGNLLFYTDGVNVFNRKHKLMAIQSGVTILGGVLANSQLATIVPKPGTCNSIYYLITTGYSAGSLFAYEIDMTEENGLGKVTADLGSIVVILGNLVSNVTVVPNCSDGYWIVGMNENNGQIVSIPLTNSGFGTPVQSTSFGGITPSSGAYHSNIKFSPNTKRLAVVWEHHVYNQGTGGVRVLDFDRATGIATSPHTFSIPAPYSNLNTNLGFTNCEFSMNSNYLYLASRINGNDIIRIDLTSSQPHNSNVISVGVSLINALTLAISGQIHFSTVQSTSLSSITNPDETNAANVNVSINNSNKTAVANLNLNNGFISKYYRSAQILSGLPHHAIICDNSLVLKSLYSGGNTTYQWYSGKNGLLTNGPKPEELEVTEADIYILEITDNGCITRAIVEVEDMDDLLSPARKEFLSCNSSIVLDAGAGFDTYNWSVGNIKDKRYVTLSASQIPQSKYLYVQVSKNGCEKSEWFEIEVEGCCAKPGPNSFQATYSSVDNANASISTIPLSLKSNTNNSSLVLQSIVGSNDFVISEIDQFGYLIKNHSYSSSNGFQVTDFTTDISNQSSKIVIGASGNYIYISEIDYLGVPVVGKSLQFSLSNSSNYTLEATSIVKAFPFGYCILINKRDNTMGTNEVFLMGLSSDFQQTWLQKINYSASNTFNFHAHKLLQVTETDMLTNKTFIVLGTAINSTNSKGVIVDVKINAMGVYSGPTVERHSNNVYFNGTLVLGSSEELFLVFTGSDDAKEFSDESTAAILKTTLDIGDLSQSIEKTIPNYRMAGIGIMGSHPVTGHSTLLLQSKTLDRFSQFPHDYFYHNLELDENLNLVNSGGLFSSENYYTKNDHNEYTCSKDLIIPTMEGGYTILGSDGQSFFLRKMGADLEGLCISKMSVKSISSGYLEKTNGSGTSYNVSPPTNNSLTHLAISGTKKCCDLTEKINKFILCNTFHAKQIDIDFTQNKSEVEVGEIVTFNVIGNYDSDIVDYFEWQWADGNVSITQDITINHSFDKIHNSWYVQLYIHFKNGCVKYVQHTTTIVCPETVFSAANDVYIPCGIPTNLDDYFNAIMFNGYNGWIPNCPVGSFSRWYDLNGNAVLMPVSITGSTTLIRKCVTDGGCIISETVVTFHAQSSHLTSDNNLILDHCEEPFCQSFNLSMISLLGCPDPKTLVSVFNVTSLPGTPMPFPNSNITLCRGNKYRFVYVLSDGCECSLDIGVRCENDPPLVPPPIGGDNGSSENRATNKAFKMHASKFSVYPNPSTGIYHLLYPTSSQEKFQISIFDLTGKVLKTFTGWMGNKNESIDISEFASGIYTAKITYGNSTQIVKLVKE